jgi:hypothetical protein
MLATINDLVDRLGDGLAHRAGDTVTQACAEAIEQEA